MICSRLWAAPRASTAGIDGGGHMATVGAHPFGAGAGGTSVLRTQNAASSAVPEPSTVGWLRLEWACWSCGGAVSALYLDLVEAVDQWIYAVRRMAEHLPKFEEAHLAPGVEAIWGNVMFPLVNHAFVTAPLDAQGIAVAAQAVMSHAAQRQVPWLFAVPQPLAPSTLALSAAGLEIAMRLTYMETDRLQQPVRPLPALEFRPIDAQSDCDVMADLNSFAYGMPPEWAREACSIASWSRDAYGAVAYVDGQPVSTATALKNGDTMNVVCVATQPEHQGRGYAEAVMRHVLEESSRRWRLSRSVLHATEAGYPVYLRMGYQPSVKFTLWSVAEPGH